MKHCECRPFSVFPRPVLLDAILSHCISFVGEDDCLGLGPGVQVAKLPLIPYDVISLISGYRQIFEF